MKPRGYLFLLGLIAFVLTVGLACSALSSTPTTQPATQPPQQQPAPTTQPNSNSNTTDTASSSALVTFTDQNKFYQIDVPGDWKHTSGTDTNLYYDTFTSPDKNAFVENVAYDDGTVWTGSSNGKAALLLLNNFYSFTRKEGDIRVSEDKIMPDNSERLTWTSKGGGYSGVSYFEVRNKTTFLMFTIEWSNDYENTYLDTLNAVVASYVVP